MTGRILVVDDQPLNIRLMEAKLGGEYYEVRAAGDGIAALERVAEDPPDLIILDVMMPRMDGFETCRRLKADPAVRHIPVVMVTALNAPEDRVRGLEAGADDFLTRPVDDLALFARMRSLLRLKQMHDELRFRLATSRDLGVIDGVENRDEDIRRTVVVATDFAPEADDLERILGKDYDVVIEDEAAGALARVAGGVVDVVLVSLAAAGFDGLRLCAAIRSNPNSRHTPVIVLGEGEDRDQVARALDLGASDYAIAPIDPNELVVRVRNQIRHHMAHRCLVMDIERSLNAAATDELTGLFGRRYLAAHLARLLAACATDRRPLALAMIDVDHFKSINDRYGHLIGDRVLRTIAHRLEDALRGSDLAVRYGGEEFVVVLPATDQAVAQAVAERLRQAVGGTPIATGTQHDALVVTISAGVASYRAGDSAETLIQRADEASYAAKRAGRNRVVVDADSALAPTSASASA
ncbi:MAG: PleD family two-component system response regulator [Alphaproteobacteria bacterium]